MSLLETFLTNSLHDIKVTKMEVTNRNGADQPTEIVYSRIDESGNEAVVFTVTVTYDVTGLLVDTVTKVAG